MASSVTHAIWMLALLLLSSCAPPPPPTHVTIELGGETWVMELAVTPAEIEQGLMHREAIPEGTGMIFIFEDSQMRSFWMGNCLTDIDLIYVDGTGRVTATHQMTSEAPRRPDESETAYRLRMPGYPSRFPARVALEFPPGTIQRLDLKPQQSTGLDMTYLDSIRQRSAVSPR